TANVVVTQAQVMCGGDTIYDVSLDGQSTPVCQPAGTAYPTFEGMPAALRIEQIPMTGPAQVTTENSAIILDSYQAQQAGVECANAGGTDTTDTTDTTTAGNDDVADESDGEPTYDLPYDVSCGCSSDGPDGPNQAPLGLALGLLVLSLTWPRRRR
ncbi:MAG: hypothetical protein KC457_33470, partial [Myxococcales bacterium]|nr:hypothetical protein [Myxococcales bacterium]